MWALLDADGVSIELTASGNEAITVSGLQTRTSAWTMRMTPFVRSAEMNKRSLIIATTFIILQHHLHLGIMPAD
jgi:hypothetical protein